MNKKVLICSFAAIPASEVADTSSVARTTRCKQSPTNSGQSRFVRVIGDAVNDHIVVGFRCALKLFSVLRGVIVAIARVLFVCGNPPVALDLARRYIRFMDRTEMQMSISGVPRA